MIETDQVNIHEGQTNSVFNKGIKIAEFDKPLLHKYDIVETIALTEDRTPKYSWEIPDTIKAATLSSDYPDFIETILTAPEEYVESTLDFQYISASSMGDVFKETLWKLIKKGRDKLNPTIVRLYDKIREKEAKTVVAEYYKVLIQRPKAISQQEMEEFLKEAIDAKIEDAEDPFHVLKDNEINVEVN